MKSTWGPTSAGRLFTSTPDWSLTLDEDKYLLRVSGRSPSNGNVLDLSGLQITPGTVWASVSFLLTKDEAITLDGIPNDDAHGMIECFQEAIDEVKRLQKIRKLLNTLNSSLQAAVQWADTATQKCKEQLKTHGWLTSEFTASLVKAKPTAHLELIGEPEIAQHLTTQSAAFQASIRLWARDTANFTTAINERHVAKELRESKRFFDEVEKSSLTEEQSRSVICFDNKVLLVASAGSGKTSTIVAKAGYALLKGYVDPESILILTFNNAGASELKMRVNDRLNRLNFLADKIVVRTFHAFGLEIIGAATGKKPSLAPWLDAGDDLRPLVEIVDTLKKDDPIFWANWEFFRIILGQDLPAFGKEEDSPDYWNSVSRKSGFFTANGETVRSRGEQVIANWLFLHGVNYQYEAAYKHDTADAQHRQYFPDFYFPEIDVYLEHWALDENGNPPSEFIGYLDGIAWKRELHQKHGTHLLETTMAQLWSGEVFEYLKRALKTHNVDLKCDPSRPIQGRKPIEHKRMARTFRSFLTHFKSNRLTIDDLHEQLKRGKAGRFLFRHALFVKLFERIFQEWETKLRTEKWVDFEDMLNQATDLIESGAWSNPYKMVLVDEFQDSSQARSRMAAALVKEPARCLFVVGDDWQSINRFAGADLNVMTNFKEHFGPFTQLILSLTFRCPQALCDISSNFIRKNPNQINKSVRSVRNDVDQPIRIVQVQEDRYILNAVQLRIEDIKNKCLKAGKENTSIFIIGRYQNDRNYSPADGKIAGISIKFLTAHSSKGLEADYVIIPRATNDLLGFPNNVADDPVLHIAMPDGDGFELSEERRLFYVALTRAKQSVTIVTIENRVSPFVHELIKDFGIPIEDSDGTVQSSIQCACGNGFIVKKSGKNGDFWGCSNFPTCRETRQYLDAPSGVQRYKYKVRVESDSGSNRVSSTRFPDVAASRPASWRGSPRSAVPFRRSPESTRRVTQEESILSPIHPTSSPTETYKLADGEIDLIGFRVHHKTLGKGVVIGVRREVSKNYISIRYAEGKISEYEETRFTGLGDWFYHSYEDAKKASTAYFRRPIEQMVLTIPSVEPEAVQSPESDARDLEERHRAKIAETDKQYLGVRLAQRGHRKRVTHCYSCRSALDNSINLECKACGWILCSCGACGCGYAGRFN